MELTIVKAVPRVVLAAYLATKVENCGESATTNIPQISMNAIKKTGFRLKSRGENKQQNPDIISEYIATLRLPDLWEIIPPNAQARLPMPMVRKEYKGTFKFISFC